MDLLHSAMALDMLASVAVNMQPLPLSGKEEKQKSALHRCFTSVLTDCKCELTHGHCLEDCQQCSGLCHKRRIGIMTIPRDRVYLISKKAGTAQYLRDLSLVVRFTMITAPLLEPYRDFYAHVIVVDERSVTADSATRVMLPMICEGLITPLQSKHCAIPRVHIRWCSKHNYLTLSNAPSLMRPVCVHCCPLQDPRLSGCFVVCPVLRVHSWHGFGCQTQTLYTPVYISGVPAVAARPRIVRGGRLMRARAVVNPSQ